MRVQEEQLGRTPAAKNREAGATAASSQNAYSAARTPGTPAAATALQRSVGNQAYVVARSMAAPAEHIHDAGCNHNEPTETTQVQRLENVLSKPGRPLTPTERAPMEKHTGANFSHVVAHEGPEADALTAEMNARALTAKKNHIVLSKKGTDQATKNHELTHVLQQASGPVHAEDDGTGVAKSNPTDDFELEASANENIPD